MLYTNLSEPAIKEKDLISDIVVNDYRTADVFRKYGINFCCGGKIALDAACRARGLDTYEIITELEIASQKRCVTPSLSYDNWSISFLTEYISNVHHSYLIKAFPEIEDYLGRFVEGHFSKFHYLHELQADFRQLHQELIPHMQQEENIIFPYIRQIENAYLKDEPYAALLVRTLRKPVENMMQHEHVLVSQTLLKFRGFTGNYAVPLNACVNHKVTFMKLRELDSDLVEHMHLENNILFPKSLAMEKELLAR
jgi:regulator of cell morphogenesis and NO signaling